MLRRLRRGASSPFGRGTDEEDAASLHCGDHILEAHSCKEEACLNSNAGACCHGAQSQRTDSVQTPGKTQSSRTIRNVSNSPHRPESSSAMASPAVTRGYYRPVSASILDDFSAGQNVSAVNITVSESRSPRLPSIPPGSRTQSREQPVFQYQATNRAILEDFGDNSPQAPPPEQRTASCGQVPGSSNSPNSRRPPQTLFSSFNESTQPHQTCVTGLRPHQLDPPSPMQPGVTPTVPSTAPVRSNNPYANLIEARQNAMTTNFLRTQEQLAGRELPSFPRDEFGFGQRYVLATEAARVILTNQRMTPDVLSGNFDCGVCTDSKPVAEFPGAAITKRCAHPPTTCLDCVATSIRSDLNNRLWNEIRCPECGETLQYDDVQRYADPETWARYETLSFRYAVSEADNFIWCTAGCGYGQVHEGGLHSPIVICLLCDQRSCFAHRVAWHENLTCEEYDALQADPANFRSRFELENEAAEEAERVLRAQEDADRVYAQSLAEELRAEEVARLEKTAREARERKERLREELRTAAEARRTEVLRRKREEEKTAATVARTTKPCPGCGWAIEKNRGCAHMTCIKCGHQFCWGCNAVWGRGHSINCRIKCFHEFCWDCLVDHQKIVETDNSVHEKGCPWHPTNLED